VTVTVTVTVCPNAPGRVLADDELPGARPGRIERANGAPTAAAP